MIEEILLKLEQVGLENDALANCYSDKYLNITRDTGTFLRLLVILIRAKGILEVGTSNGYSTIWLASGLQGEGKIVTVDSSLRKLIEAEENFKAAEVSHFITTVHSDSVAYLASAEGEYDLIFLDADRSTYLASAPHILKLLKSGGLIVCDNAVSHQDELLPFVEFVNALPAFTTAFVPVGKGEFLALKP